MYATMLIAVPTGVKVFNWIATMWQGSMTFETPMLFADRLHLRVHDRRLHRPDARRWHPIDIQLHDTYYVVAHFHYVLVAGLAVRAVRGHLLLAAEVDRPHVRRDARQAALLAVADLLQRDLLPACTSSAWPACRAAIADYAMQFADFNMPSPRSAPSASV
jgi:cytochrome c oxidase subunit 1